MSRHVTRLYLIELVNQAYLNQENNFFFFGSNQTVTIFRQLNVLRKN